MMKATPIAIAAFFTYISLQVGHCTCFITNKSHNIGQTFQRSHHFSHHVHHPSLTKLSSSKNDENVKNPIEAFISTLPTIGNKVKLKSKEQELRELKKKTLMDLEIKEQERAQQVKSDALPYLFLLSLQTLPLFSSITHDSRYVSLLYFFGVAVCTVYVGGRQITLEDSEIVKKENALAAPIGASISIGVLYSLIKLGLDPGILYAIAVSAFGALAISDIGVPILRNVLPASFANGKVQVSESLRQTLKLEQDEDLPLDGVTTLLLGILCTAGYWAPFAMEQKFILSNFIAWALAMTSLGAISLGSFQTATILLSGLFFYDIFWVFGTDVMMTVATKIEAPVKFLYTAAPPAEGAPVREYNFSVLGLGDIVVPGLFIRFMSKIDQVLKPATFSYFNSAAIAYALGLGICFGVNEITHAGQPALLYLDPACIGSALACGVVNGQLKDVWNFEEEMNKD